jgi:hypothetical protein
MYEPRAKRTTLQLETTAAVMCRICGVPRMTTLVFFFPWRNHVAARGSSISPVASQLLLEGCTEGKQINTLFCWGLHPRGVPATTCL